MSLTLRQTLTVLAECDMIPALPGTKATQPPFASTTVGLAVGVTAAVVLACAGGAFLFSQHHMQSLLETARQTALAEGDLIRVALEHQMIENDRTLIGKIIKPYGRRWGGEGVVLLDRPGARRFPAGNGTPDAE